MKVALTTLAAVTAGLTISVPALADGRSETFTMREGGALVLAVPDGWKQSFPGTDEGAILRFEPATGERFSLQISPYPAPAPMLDRAILRERLRESVEKVSGRILPSAVEKSLPLQPIGEGAEGFWFAATDRSPGPGEFASLTQGAVAVDGRLILFFTVLSDPGSTIPRQALQMLRTARYDAGIASLEKVGDRFRISLPGGRGTLSFPSRGFTVEQRDDARPYYFLVDREAALNVSFNFEPAVECRTSEACRDRFSAKLAKGLPGRRDWRRDRVGDVFISEATDPGTPEVPIRQRHVNAHLIINGVWVDVHLSKVLYEDSDRPLFLDFVRSLRAEPSGSSGPAAP